MPGLTEEYGIGVEFLERYEIRLDPKRRRLVLPPKRRMTLILVCFWPVSRIAASGGEPE